MTPPRFGVGGGGRGMPAVAVQLLERRDRFGDVGLLERELVAALAEILEDRRHVLAHSALAVPVKVFTLRTPSPA